MVFAVFHWDCGFLPSIPVVTCVGRLWLPRKSAGRIGRLWRCGLRWPAGHRTREHPAEAFFQCGWEVFCRTYDGEIPRRFYGGEVKPPMTKLTDLRTTLLEM